MIPKVWSSLERGIISLVGTEKGSAGDFFHLYGKFDNGTYRMFDFQKPFVGFLFAKFTIQTTFKEMNEI